MNRLDKKIRELRKNKKKVLVAFITAGYPDMGSTEELVKILENAGTDIIELGVPFSDPVADGPTIQYSSEMALRKGANLPDIFSLVKKIRKSSDIPILLMSYLNPVYRLGLERSAEKAFGAGVDGFIIPDMIPEESRELERYIRKFGLDLVFLAAPNTPAKRLGEIDKKSRGFVYVVSLTGVTGKRKGLSEGLKSFLAESKKRITKNARLLGFGISNPGQVMDIKGSVDGIIVGSALVEIIRGSGGRKVMKEKLARFVRSLRKALDK